MDTSTSSVGIADVKPVWRIGRAAVAAAVLVAAVLAGVMSRRPLPLDVSTVRPTPFAVEAAAEYDPAWSPDGRSVAYVRGGEPDG